MVDVSGFEAHADAALAALDPKLRELGRRMQLRIARRIRGHILPKGGTPGKRVTGNRIGNRSRRLWDALEEGKAGNFTEYSVDLAGLLVVTGIDGDLVPYAVAHEYGATIRPKNAKALIVPVSQEAEDALAAAGGNVRSLGLFILHREGKPPLLVKKIGGSLKTYFVLKASVKIPKRSFREPGVDDFATADLPEFAMDLGEDILEVWNAS